MGGVFLWTKMYKSMVIFEARQKITEKIFDKYGYVYDNAVKLPYRLMSCLVLEFNILPTKISTEGSCLMLLLGPGKNSH